MSIPWNGLGFSGCSGDFIFRKSLTQNVKDRFPLAKSSSHYKLVKRPSPYDLIPTGRKGASIWLTLLAIIVGLICIGPNVIVLVRLSQVFYRLGTTAITFFHLLLHTG